MESDIRSEYYLSDDGPGSPGGLRVRVGSKTTTGIRGKGGEGCLLALVGAFGEYDDGCFVIVGGSSQIIRGGEGELGSDILEVLAVGIVDAALGAVEYTLGV